MRADIDVGDGVERISGIVIDRNSGAARNFPVPGTGRTVLEGGKVRA